MKKSTKVILILAIVFFSVGICFVSVGAICGGVKACTKWFKAGDLSFNFGIFDWYEPDYSIDDDYPVYEGNGMEQIDIADETINKMVVSVEGALLEVKEGADNIIDLRYEDANDLQCYVEGTVLYVVQDIRGVHVGDGTEVYITLPKDISFEEIIVEVGAGKVNISDTVSARTIIEVGAGKLELNNVDLGIAEIEIGAGAGTVNGGKAKELAIEVGIGAFNYEGTVKGNVGADCSMGSISLDIEGKKSDYNYDVDCAMGRISVGGTSYSGLGREKYINNGSSYTFVLECSMGNISVKFR